MEAERHNPKFDEIVSHLVTEDPSFGAATRTPLAWNRPARLALAVAAAIVWAGLSVLMVVWGWRGLLVALPVVVVGVVIAVHLTRGASAKTQVTGTVPPARDEKP